MVQVPAYGFSPVAMLRERLLDLVLVLVLSLLLSIEVFKIEYWLLAIHHCPITKPLSQQCYSSLFFQLGSFHVAVLNQVHIDAIGIQGAVHSSIPAGVGGIAFWRTACRCGQTPGWKNLFGTLPSAPNQSFSPSPFGVKADGMLTTASFRTTRVNWSLRWQPAASELVAVYTVVTVGEAMGWGQSIQLNVGSTGWYYRLALKAIPVSHLRRWYRNL